jgi:hypothetical protein
MPKVSRNKFRNVKRVSFWEVCGVYTGAIPYLFCSKAEAEKYAEKCAAMSGAGIKFAIYQRVTG